MAEPEAHRGISWGTMLVIIAVAIAAAGAIAYQIVAPFFAGNR